MKVVGVKAHTENEKGQILLDVYIRWRIQLYIYIWDSLQKWGPVMRNGLVSLREWFKSLVYLILCQKQTKQDCQTVANSDLFSLTEFIQRKNENTSYWKPQLQLVFSWLGLRSLKSLRFLIYLWRVKSNLKSPLRRLFPVTWGMLR